MNYFLSAILLIVILFTFTIGLNYLIKARTSVLYSAVSKTCIVASFFSLTYLINNFYEINYYGVIRSILLALLVYLTFNLWKITYNQISNKVYTGIIALLILLQLLIDIFVNLQNILITGLMIISDYSLIYIFVYLLTILKFYNDRNLNKIYEFNFIPLILLIFLMSLLSESIVSSDLIIVFNILQISSYLLLSLVYYKDYKLSLYF